MYELLLALGLFLTCLSTTTTTTTGELVQPGKRDLYELSIIHLNDFHARFEQTNPSSSLCRPEQEKECVGGIARVYTAVNQLKKERPNAIFLNAGDHFQGTLWYNIHKWNVTAVFMNMLPHDAMTIGNHEFDDGIDGLVPFLKAVNAPVVVTNIDDSEEPRMKGLYRNSTILEKGGRRIGVIGAILSTTNTIAETENLRFLDEVDSINEEAERLKRQGINIIIVLSHCGLSIDRVIAANCPLVDVIVGGHSHTFLYHGTPPSNDVPEDDYPVVVKQDSLSRTVLIVQAAAFTKYLGNLTVWFDEKGEVADWQGNAILLDHSVKQDPGVLEALIPWRKDIDDITWKQVGKTKVLLDSKCKGKECNLGNFIADAMVDTYVDAAESKTYWTYAAIACTNTGGIRASIDGFASDIFYGDLMMIQPFGNTWDTVEVQGSSIRYILEYERILVWSGLKVTYNMSKDAATRLVDVKVRCRACEVPKYEELIDDEWYRVVVPSFLIEGGDNLQIFNVHGRNRQRGTLDIENLVKYVAKMSPIIAETDNRVKFIYAGDQI